MKLTTKLLKKLIKESLNFSKNLFSFGTVLLPFNSM